MNAADRAAPPQAVNRTSLRTTVENVIFVENHRGPFGERGLILRFAPPLQ
jgi:hypothetical protein